MIALVEPRAGLILAQAVVDPDQEIAIAQGTRLEDSHMEVLRQLSVRHVLVRQGPGANQEVPREQNIAPNQRATGERLVEEVCQQVDQSLDRCLDAAGRASLRRDIQAFVQELIASIDEGSLLNLNSLKEHSRYNFQHSVDVCVFAIVFGKSLDLSASDLRILGMGALLHDIGKALIAPRILNKAGSLSPSERLEVQAHSEYGRQLLLGSELMSDVPDVIEIVAQHHERYAGGGYPLGLRATAHWDPAHRSADCVHPLAQIISICDVFDALTSERPYRRAMSYPQALEFMNTGMAGMFHPQLIERFGVAVNLYPIGSVVRLSRGAHRGFVGTVVRSSSLPGVGYSAQVRLLYDSRRRKLRSPFVVSIRDDC